jgi:hypothetical protein
MHHAALRRRLELENRMKPSDAIETVKMVPPPTATAAARFGARWGQRLGVAGFVFFLIKGLLWLLLPALLAYMGYR